MARFRLSVIRSVMEMSIMDTGELRKSSHQEVDRLTGKPLHLDISDLPMKRGITTNRNNTLYFYHFYIV